MVVVPHFGNFPSTKLICTSMNILNMWELCCFHWLYSHTSLNTSLNYSVYYQNLWCLWCLGSTIWSHNESVKYFSGPGLFRKQGHVISHYFQYSLTRGQKLTICFTRGNIYTNINIVNPKNCLETLFESFVSCDIFISTSF